MTDPIRLNPVQPSASQPNKPQATQPGGQSFADHLEEAKKIKFSNHAQKRLEVRAVEMDEKSIGRLSTAVDKAEAHGAKESLILMDDLAFIVNVRERMVVTTVDMNRRKEGVFTQIDTVVFADAEKPESNTGNAPKTDTTEG